jgi:hypothetical protein
MKYKEFKELIHKMIEFQENCSKARALGIDLIEYNELPNSIIWSLIDSYYGEDGSNWIAWYLYDTKKDLMNFNNPSAWNKDGKPICYDLKSLWAEVESIRKNLKK